MSRRNPPPQDPNNPDAIMHAGSSYAPHQLQAESHSRHVNEGHSDTAHHLKSTRHHDGEGSLKELEELISHIENFGNARGEVSAKWVRGVTRLLQKSEGRVNILATVENLRTLLDRVHRGEFFVTFKREICEPFMPDKIVVLGDGRDGPTLEKSKRPPPESLKPVLGHSKTYANVSLKSQDDIKRDEWMGCVKAIVRRYKEYWPELMSQADKWEQDMLGEKVGQMAWKIRGKGKFIRSNLVYASERVRTGEILPDVKVMVKGDLGPPQNVSPSDPCFVHNSYSLARISIRQARRIGFSGDRAHHGGLYFS